MPLLKISTVSSPKGLFLQLLLPSIRPRACPQQSVSLATSMRSCRHPLPSGPLSLTGLSVRSRAINDAWLFIGSVYTVHPRFYILHTARSMGSLWAVHTHRNISNRVGLEVLTLVIMKNSAFSDRPVKVN